MALGLSRGRKTGAPSPVELEPRRFHVRCLWGCTHLLIKDGSSSAGVSARSSYLLGAPNVCIDMDFETIANPYGAYRNLVLEFNN